MEIEITSETTKALALANNLVNGIESLVADCLCEDAYIISDISKLTELLGEELEIGLSRCHYEHDNLFELNNLLKFNLIRDIRIKAGNAGTSYRKLYELAAELCIEKVVPYMRSVSVRTAATRIEYMYLVLKNGVAELLEGEADRVAIPHVDACLMVHTHKFGCAPSSNDLKTASEVFFDGGLGVGIVSPTCYFLLLRFGPFTEEDYLSLKNLNSSGTSFLLPSRRYVSNNLVVLIG